MSRSNWGVIRLCGILTVCAAAPRLPAQAIIWQDDYNQGRAAATATNRPLLLTVVGHNSVPCRQLIEGTFAEPTVATVVNHSFVAVRLDAQRYPEYVKQLHLRSLPITIFASANGDIVHAVDGPADAKTMAIALQQTLAKLPRLTPTAPARPVSLASAPAVANSMPAPMPVAGSAASQDQPSAWGYNAMYPAQQQPGYQNVPVWMYTNAPAFTQPRRSC